MEKRAAKYMQRLFCLSNPHTHPLNKPLTTHLHSFAHYPFAWQSHFAVRPGNRKALVSASCDTAKAPHTGHQPPTTNECTWGGWVGAGTDVCEYFEVRLIRA